MQVSGETMIFRNEHDSANGKWYSYSAGISSKEMDGTWTSDYIDAKFRKEVVLENKTKINIKEGYLKTRKYTDKNGVEQKRKYILVLDFEALEQGDITGFSQLSDNDIPF